MNKSTPLVLHADLTCSWFVVTRYVRRDGGVIVASTKYDVTEQFHAMAATGMLRLPRCCRKRVAAPVVSAPLPDEPADPG